MVVNNRVVKKRADLEYIYGRHAVLEALRRCPAVVERVFVREDLACWAAIKKELNQVAAIQTFAAEELPVGSLKGVSHQGLIASIDIAKLLVPFKTFRDNLEPTKNRALVLLGEVHDPHNVGAIIRSAVAFGAAGVLLPKHRSCPLTGAVIKASAGLAFNLPLVMVPNVNTALRDLKARGFWIYGLSGAGEQPLPAEQFTKPAVFVVGNEANGLREKTAALCDRVLTIPTDQRAESLNVSVAAAVALYAWSSQQNDALA